MRNAKPEVFLCIPQERIKLQRIVQGVCRLENKRGKYGQLVIEPEGE
jgi:hypothetical protein